MSRMVKMPHPSPTVREGAAEVTEKLKSDLSRWTRARRVVSLKPMIGCMSCDATGRLVCESCGGTGRMRMQFREDAPGTCVSCDGTGHITCVACAGQGQVANTYRKTMLWILAVGVLAWLLILFQLWGRDLLPAQRAAVFQRGEHGQSAMPGARTHGLQGGGVSAPGAGGMSAPAPRPAMNAPGNGTAMGGGYSMPAPARSGSGYTVPGGGGVAAPGGGYAMPGTR